jgi:hypothetical protein
MDTTRETLLVRDTKQQRRERIPFCLAEGTKQVLLMFARHAADGLEDTAALSRQHQRIRTPILRVR